MARLFHDFSTRSKWGFTKIKDPQYRPQIVGSPHDKDPNKVPPLSETLKCLPSLLVPALMVTLMMAWHVLMKPVFSACHASLIRGFHINKECGIIGPKNS